MREAGRVHCKRRLLFVLSIGLACPGQWERGDLYQLFGMPVNRKLLACPMDVLFFFFTEWTFMLNQEHNPFAEFGIGGRCYGKRKGKQRL